MPLLTIFKKLPLILGVGVLVFAIFYIQSLKLQVSTAEAAEARALDEVATQRNQLNSLESTIREQNTRIESLITVGAAMDEEKVKMQEKLRQVSSENRRFNQELREAKNANKEFSDWAALYHTEYVNRLLNVSEPPGNTLHRTN